MPSFAPTLPQAPGSMPGVPNTLAKPNAPGQPTTLKSQKPSPNPVGVKPVQFAQATPQGMHQAAQQAMKAGYDTLPGTQMARMAVLYGVGGGEYGPDVAAMFGKEGGDDGYGMGSGDTSVGSGGGFGSVPHPLAALPWVALTKFAANGVAAAASMPPSGAAGMAPPMTAGAPMAQPGAGPTPAGQAPAMPPGAAPGTGVGPMPGQPMGSPPMGAPPAGAPGSPPPGTPGGNPKVKMPDLASDLVSQGKNQPVTVGDTAKMQNLALKPKQNMQAAKPLGGRAPGRMVAGPGMRRPGTPVMGGLMRQKTANNDIEGDWLSKLAYSFLPGSPTRLAVRPTQEREQAIVRSAGDPRKSVVEGASLGGAETGSTLGGLYGAYKGRQLAHGIFDKATGQNSRTATRGVKGLIDMISKNPRAGGAGRLAAVLGGVGVLGGAGSLLGGSVGSDIGRSSAETAAPPMPTSGQSFKTGADLYKEALFGQMGRMLGRVGSGYKTVQVPKERFIPQPRPPLPAPPPMYQQIRQALQQRQQPYGHYGMGQFTGWNKLSMDNCYANGCETLPGGGCSCNGKCESCNPREKRGFALAAAGAGIGGLVGGAEGAAIGGGIGAGAGMGSYLPMAAMAAHPRLRFLAKLTYAQGKANPVGRMGPLLGGRVQGVKDVTKMPFQDRGLRKLYGAGTVAGATGGGIVANNQIKKGGDYTFDAEDCPKCKVSMEGDSYTGSCNSCGHKWGEKKATLTADEGGEDAPAAPGSPMRGWQWKVLQKDQAAAQKAWMPRVFRNDSTPLTELLASPGKQGLLGGLAGGAAGAGAGYMASKGMQAAGLGSGTGTPDWQNALIGGGIGALLGGVKAYGHRRKNNDLVTDALRRTPPGATVKDYKMVQESDKAIEAAKKKPKAPAPLAPAPEPKKATKAAFDVRDQDGNRYTVGEIATKYANMIRDAVARDRASGAFDYLLRKMAAHNGDLKGPIVASASGESKGLSFADAGPIRHGQDAWSDISRFMKGHKDRKSQPNPFEGKHAADLTAQVRPPVAIPGTAGPAPVQRRPVVKRPPPVQPMYGAAQATGNTMKVAAVTPNWLKTLGGGVQSLFRNPAAVGREAKQSLMGRAKPIGDGLTTAAVDAQKALATRQDALRATLPPKLLGKPAQADKVIDRINKRLSADDGAFGGRPGAAFFDPSALHNPLVRRQLKVRQMKSRAEQAIKDTVAKGTGAEQSVLDKATGKANSFARRVGSLGQRTENAAYNKQLGKQVAVGTGAAGIGGGGIYAASGSSPAPMEPQPADARMKAASAPTIINVGNLGSEPKSGTLTTLGGAGLIGSGIAGLGSAATSMGSGFVGRKLQGFADKIKARDPYLPGSTARIQGFQDALAGAKTPQQKMNAYVGKGSELMGSPAFKGGLTGRDVMQKIYTNPLLKGVASRFVDKPENFAWNEGKAQHYGEFAKGPVRATEQLGREILGDKGHEGLTGQARTAIQPKVQADAANVLRRLAPRVANKEGLVGQLGAKVTGLRDRTEGQLARVRERYEKMNRGTADAKVQKIEAALQAKGKLAPGQTVWDSPFKDKVQIHHSRVDQARDQLLGKLKGGREANIGAKATELGTQQGRLDSLRGRLGEVATDGKLDAGKVDGLTQRRLQEALKKTRALDPTTQAMRLNLSQLAGGKSVNIDKLPPADQQKLIEKFTKTQAGKEMAKRFATQFEGPMNQYNSLGEALKTPKRVIDGATGGLEGGANRAARIAKGARGVGKGALLAAVPSAAMYATGRSMDASAHEQAQNNLHNRFAETVARATRGGDAGKYASDSWLEKLANPLASKGAGLFGKLFGKAAPAAPAAPGAVIPKAVPSMAGRAWGAAAPQLMPAAMGGVGGYMTGESMGVDPWASAATGAAAFTPWGRQLAARGGAKGMTPVHAVRGAIGGNFAGSMADQTAGAFGYDTKGRFARMGTYAGGGLGLMRGGGGVMASKGGSGYVASAGRDMTRLGAKGMAGMQNFTRGTFDPIVGGGRRALNWLSGGRMFAAPAAKAAPTVARRLGQVAMGGTLAAGAGGMAMGYLNNKFDQKANETFEAGLGALDEYADNKFDQYTQAAPGALARGAVNALDPMFSQMGMDPSSMHPMQKAMMLGGAGVGAYGMATGNPWAMGAGALTAGGGYMANKFNPLSGGYDGGGGQMNYSSDRNELAHQQQLSQQRAAMPPPQPQAQPPGGQGGMTGQGWM